jgi:sugar phosphate isomerase/epimerase
VRGDLAAEARHHRELPGRGAGDTLGVLTALRDAGVRAPVSVEVFSDRLDALAATEAARSAYAAAAAVLTTARWPGSAAWTTTTERARAAASHGGA